ncbi:MAG TPA: sigma 54-interacting transcriptional regulator [Polyangia bacterium]
MAQRSRGVGETTLRASDARRTGTAGEGLAIHWLFPATDGPVTPLFGGGVGGRLVLGRGDDCRTVLPGAEVSRHHAEIVQNGPLAILRDLDSRNGSHVNGVRTREAPLDRGDVVRLGEWIGVVAEVAPELQGAPHGPSAIATGLYGGGFLRGLLEPVLRAAASDLPVLIEGETGTGKEVVARAIHAASGRPGSFVAVNCAALPESLAEGELFGYRRGAFTGADRANPGHFRAAHDGTLLLDEITDFPPALQAKILRVLEQREIVPLGESHPVPVNTRVVAAAQQSLVDAVAAKTFRADLFARLEGICVRLPPLRERVEDVPYIFSRLLHELSGGRPPSVDPLLVERLCLYDWPLNVRELVTLVRRLLVMHGHEPSLKLGHLPHRIASAAAGRSESAGASGAELRPASGARLDPREQEERDAADFARLMEELHRHSGNVSRAAVAAGLSRQRAYRLLRARPEVDLPGLLAGLRDSEDDPRSRTP